MAELAHITSRGMGGGTTRNRPSNVFAACSSHARISDLLPPPGGTAADVYDQIRLVPGCGDVKPGDRIGARLAAGLTVWVASITFVAE